MGGGKDPRVQLHKFCCWLFKFSYSLITDKLSASHIPPLELLVYLFIYLDADLLHLTKNVTS